MTDTRRFKTEKEKIAFLLTKRDEIDQIVDEIKKKFEKHIIKDSWYMGGTEIFPITIYRDYIKIEITTSDRRIFNQRSLDKIVNGHKDLLDYATVDSNLRFYFYK